MSIYGEGLYTDADGHEVEPPERTREQLAAREWDYAGVEPAPDALLQSFGNFEVGRGAPLPLAVALHERAGLHEVPKYLAEKERVAVGLGVQRLDEIARRCGNLLTGKGIDEVGDLAHVETVQRQPLHTRLPPQVAEQRRQRVRAIEVGVAVGAEYDERDRRGHLQ